MNTGTTNFITTESADNWFSYQSHGTTDEVPGGGGGPYDGKNFDQKFDP